MNATSVVVEYRSISIIGHGLGDGYRTNGIKKMLGPLLRRSQPVVSLPYNAVHGAKSNGAKISQMLYPNLLVMPRGDIDVGQLWKWEITYH